ncbi:MAG: hypothetical protein KJP21_01280 [Bacteroidia bacterium]|nr:hypothetical protein [Bacteroidia bacterium]NNJ56534.1 hypothetical protein [Bacteroidia bacterium]
MFGLNFSRLPRHRKFTYTPLYYDEQSEELKSRVEQIKREMGEEQYTQDSTEASIRSAFKARKAPDRYSGMPSQKYYGLKILTIAFVLGFVFYKVLNSNLIEIIFGHLNK